MRVIIESPYAGNVELNLRYLRACMHDSLMRGEAPFASHGLYTQPGVLDDNIPDERIHGIKAGFAWRRVAEMSAFYGDLGISDGMRKGLENCLKYGYQFEYRVFGGIWKILGDQLAMVNSPNGGWTDQVNDAYAATDRYASAYL